MGKFLILFAIIIGGFALLLGFIGAFAFCKKVEHATNCKLMRASYIALYAIPALCFAASFAAHAQWPGAWWIWLLRFLPMPLFLLPMIWNIRMLGALCGALYSVVQFIVACALGIAGVSLVATAIFLLVMFAAVGIGYTGIEEDAVRSREEAKVNNGYVTDRYGRKILLEGGRVKSIDGKANIPEAGDWVRYDMGERTYSITGIGEVEKW